ncbi:helix-turn-helix transcriptional regulator [Clostridium saccharobutylicum]|uniref:HTH-type transcriptional regulator MalT n=1 Tax=Clostridium saccharobutylicum TaxID=169679 RepID=A0A1S8NIF2_CLOSA|nr:LuxR C-terminal-related transcriptional regulator [Clostridium saccharobutylicum]OOM16188.1 HTH-type transcriptional regulator MalT [Clostridium saccharobutylicum]
MMNGIFRPKLVHRKRITSMLSQIFEVPVFFISAPMGYGKTTSVRNFLENKKEIQTIWFDVGNKKNDDIWMWYKFCKSIKSSNLSLSKRLSEYGFPKSDKYVYEIIDIIKDELKQKTVIVIDDWYDKETEYINDFLKIICLEEISNLHIVIISRNRPSNEYIELELKQKCIIMWQDDISFTFEETVEFFKLNRIKLSDKEKKEVYEYTGGWTSATYLALLRYHNKNTFDNIPKATELIKIAVYDKFDETTKEILLKLASVENFTLEQAIYITGNQKCGLVIKKLISNNCFIRYDMKSKLYTIHSILKSALQEELLYSDIDFNKINNASGDWYSQNNDDIQAIKYYYKAKNFNRVLDLIERNYTIDLTNLWQRIINSVFEELNIDEKINRPIAYLTYIFFYILYGNAVSGRKLLYEAKSIYEKDENLKDKNQVLGEIAFVESLLIMNNVEKMIEYHKKAYEFLNGGISKIANDKMPVTFGSPHFLCLYYRKKGRLKENAECFEKGIKYFIHISNGGATGSNYLIRAEYLFETGNVDDAELFAYKALHKAKIKKQTSIIICSLFLLMRICLNKNNRREAISKLKILIKEYQKLNIPSFLKGEEIPMGYIYGITGNLEEMNKWIKNYERPKMQNISPVTTLRYIVSALAMILKESYIELEVEAETMLEVCKDKSGMFGIIYSYIFDSIAKYNLYGIEKAKDSLMKAIWYAKEDRVVMCFAELAPHILPILRYVEKEEEYVKVLLPNCEKFNYMYMKNYSNDEKIELTPREIEVIKLVNRGYKQSEISEILNIALITVKKHIAAVYSKLKVKNKTTALNILKEKGII